MLGGLAPFLREVPAFRPEGNGGFEKGFLEKRLRYSWRGFTGFTGLGARQPIAARVMRAAILTGRDPQHFVGGIELYCVQLANLLQKWGVEVEIFHFDPAVHPEGYSEFESRCYEIGKVFHSQDQRFDLAIANSYFGFGYFPPRVRTFTIYHIVHAAFAEAIRDVMPRSEYLKYLYQCGELGDVISGFGRNCVAVSGSVKMELEQQYGLTDVRVVNNGIDTNLFRRITDRRALREKWEIPLDAFVGIYVGRWDLTKGCDVLQSVILNSPETFWVLALGPGGVPCSLQGTSGVMLKEGLPWDLLVELYSLADFVLFPSRYESFGYAIVEAMACELPVITTPVGVAKEIYAADPLRPFLLPAFPSGKEELVASALHAIFTLRWNRRLGEHVGKVGRSEVVRRFSLERWEAEMASVLGLSENE